MRVSHAQEKTELNQTDYVAWRFLNCREKHHRDAVKKKFNSRLRIRGHHKH